MPQLAIFQTLSHIPQGAMLTLMQCFMQCFVSIDLGGGDGHSRKLTMHDQTRT